MNELKISLALEEKRKQVGELAKQMKETKTILIASTKSLPSSQFHEIKKKLRGRADLKVAKKSIIIRAIETTEKGALQNIKSSIGADIVLFFSDLDTFELSGVLSDNQGPAKAKTGDIALEDITIDSGPTELLPGPAISELSGVGLKVVVESGKLTIKQGLVVAKKGTPIKENVASVLNKLNILPMRVGFIPIAAYDAVSDKVYTNIRIDKKETLEDLKATIGKAFWFAINMKYTSKETISFFIQKAGREEKAIENLINKNHKEES